MNISIYSARRSAESGRHPEHIDGTGVDATAAVHAVSRRDQGRAVAPQCRHDHMRLGTDMEAGAAIRAVLPVLGRDPREADLADQAVERPDRAQMPAPAAARHQEIEQEDRDDDAPSGPDAEDQPALRDADGVQELPGDGAGDGRCDQRGCEDPQPRAPIQLAVARDAELVPQPVGGVRYDVDRADPAAIRAPPTVA